MDFFIDKKFWNKVIKKSPASTGVWIKQNLSDWHTKVENYWIDKKELSPAYLDAPSFMKGLWDVYGDKGDKYIITQVQKSKVTKLGKYLKKDFVLNFPNTEDKLGYYEIDEGFLYKTCFSYEPKNKLDHVPIEKVIIEILIQDYGLSEDVFYKGKPVVELEEWNPEVKLEQCNSFDIYPIETPSKGFVYLIRNEDIFKIGITENLLRRFKKLKPDEIINVVRCSNYESLEKALHKKFKDNRIPQTEYFRLDKHELELVNIEMIKGAEF